jgi:hypothetical protein
MNTKYIKGLSAVMLLGSFGCGEAAPPPGFEDESWATTTLASSHAAQAKFRAVLSGDQEVPPVDTRARGKASFQLSPDGSELSYTVVVANLNDVTQAHIHWAMPGTNGPVVVWLYPSEPPAQLIEGRLSGVLVTGVIQEENLVGPLAGEPLESLINAMSAEELHVNVHTLAHPPGEIRGQIQ